MLLAVDLLHAYSMRLRYSLPTSSLFWEFVIKGRALCHWPFQRLLWWMCWTTPTSLERSQLCDGGWSFWCIVNSVFYICDHQETFFSPILMMSLSDFDIRVILFSLSHVVSCVSLLFAAVVKIMTTGNWEGKGLFGIQNKVHCWRKSSQELKEGKKPEAELKQRLEEHYLKPCTPGSHQLPSYTNYDNLPRKGTAHLNH